MMPDKNVKYSCPNNIKIGSEIQAFDIAFTNYCNEVEYIVSASYSWHDMIDIIIRIDQRDYYHYIFHDMPKGMNEIRQVSICCYWILKYRPLKCDFREKNQWEKEDGKARIQYDRAHSYFTERFCIYLLESVCNAFFNKDLEISDVNRAELEYALRHADISKEAMMIIFQQLVDISIL